MQTFNFTSVRKHSGILFLMLLLVSSFSFTSCATDDDYDEPYADYSIVGGAWALIEANGLEVFGDDPATYDLVFWANGEGCRNYINVNGGYQVPFEWRVDASPQGAEYLYIWDYNGAQYRYILRIEVYDYTWYLTLTDIDSGDVLTFQRYNPS